MENKTEQKHFILALVTNFLYFVYLNAYAVYNIVMMNQNGDYSNSYQMIHIVTNIVIALAVVAVSFVFIVKKRVNGLLIALPIICTVPSTLVNTIASFFVYGNNYGIALTNIVTFLMVLLSCFLPTLFIILFFKTRKTAHKKR